MLVVVFEIGLGCRLLGKGDLPRIGLIDRNGGGSSRAGKGLVDALFPRLGLANRIHIPSSTCQIRALVRI